ncbi:hypothetical protein P5G65_06075 [Paenibacillus chondroitinus]|uniref:Uncharacterized protein n=1 Tax=Paenibacillus chondroitinus TaxID=59842 RepID=A0ABU6D986_9BACL|nr:MULTISPECIES: hypothetical protein [Paenibacillus]MCY9661193.1 hypothetical protein [Paenibacillus anseongense]MEB4793457.1 hypothetical protein [Paenibacillus chondroitinus]
MSQGKQNHTGHLFTVEILIEEATNGLAMEKLLHLLNAQTVKDYKILKGIELGKLIEMNTTKKESTPPSYTGKKAVTSPPPAAPAPPITSTAPSGAADHIITQLEGFKANNTLIRLTVIKGQGIKLNLPCRILNYDSSNQNVAVYHVDEKKVYSFKLNEIDDYVAY